jgi:hypothetical protein
MLRGIPRPDCNRDSSRPRSPQPRPPWVRATSRQLLNLLRGRRDTLTALNVVSSLGLKPTPQAARPTFNSAQPPGRPQNAWPVGTASVPSIPTLAIWLLYRRGYRGNLRSSGNVGMKESLRSRVNLRMVGRKRVITKIWSAAASPSPSASPLAGSMATSSWR